MIVGIKIETDEWCFNGEVIKLHVVNFFKELYTMDEPVNGVLLCHGKFLLLLLIENEGLLLVTSDEEIRRYVFNMNPMKSPGINGFHTKFY